MGILIEFKLIFVQRVLPHLNIGTVLKMWHGEELWSNKFRKTPHCGVSLSFKLKNLYFILLWFIYILFFNFALLLILLFYTSSLNCSILIPLEHGVFRRIKREHYKHSNQLLPKMWLVWLHESKFYEFIFRIIQMNSYQWKGGLL